MKFFVGTDGHHYRIDDIVSISQEREIEGPRGPRKVHRVLMDKAETAEIWSYDLNSIVADNGTIMPAAVGTYALHWDADAPEDDGLIKSVVIGWRIGSDASVVEPITADGVNDGLDNSPAVMMPDGSVVSPNMSSWPDVAAWMDEQMQHAAIRRTKL